MSNHKVNWERWHKVSQEHFSKVAPRYDAGRTFEDGFFWAREIAARVPLSEEERLLDMGCGTGLFSLPFAEALPCAVVGLDASPPMLAEATSKKNANRVHWLLGQDENLPFGDNAFQAVFLSQVWHHLSDGEHAVREFHRILKPGGVLFVKTFSHAQIRARWDLTTVFPELLPFMLSIYPDIPAFNTILSQADFIDFTCKNYCKEGTLRPSTLLKMAEEKLWSMFAYISEEGLQRGIAYLRQLIAEKNDAPIPRCEMHLLISARK